MAFVDGAISGWIGSIIAFQFAALPALLSQSAFEGYYGMTVGKHPRGIVVGKADGSPIAWRVAVVRSLLRPVGGLPVPYLVGIVAAYATGAHQRVGDVAGGTAVVRAGD
ncbi:MULTISPECIES: RDD family protein [Natrialbaceae]|uniref:RDD family protein n=1 Tax=Natrialbaceae TaxID=1644061 RepID=UPI00207D021E|nr:RDD family protein [Natronococcus sp. CG52]